MFQVNVTLQTITVQSLSGTRTLLNSSDVLLLPKNLDNQVCINVVLGVGTQIVFPLCTKLKACMY